MMMAGCFGLLRAYASRRPGMARSITQSLDQVRSL
jgi:hypothetical protein